MDQISKRKKRKTRKCLNELRKNFNGKLNNEDSLCVNSTHNINSKQNNINKANCIAGTDRLTLGLFHKTVRSETITRSALSEVNLESVTNVNTINNKTNLIHDRNCCQLRCLGCSTENSLHSCSINVLNIKKQKIQETCNITSNKNFLINHNDKLSNSPVVYSPIKVQVTMTPMFDALENLSVTESSPERSQSEDVNQFYEDLIQSMSKHLKEKTPALIRHNIMNQSKDYLHNLFIDDYHCETENNILQCIKKDSHGNKSQIVDATNFSPQESVEEDPMNYIKMRCVQEQSDPCETVTSTSISSPSSTFTALNISHTSQSSVRDTPEYIYFPHKLNQ